VAFFNGKVFWSSKGRQGKVVHSWWPGSDSRSDQESLQAKRGNGGKSSPKVLGRWPTNEPIVIAPTIRRWLALSRSPQGFSPGRVTLDTSKDAPTDLASSDLDQGNGIPKRGLELKACWKKYFGQLPEKLVLRKGIPSGGNFPEAALSFGSAWNQKSTRQAILESAFRVPDCEHCTSYEKHS
jgi:hypothetical protein